jgi:hypothetical protein
MPTEVKGALDLRKALKKFTPDLAKETQKELGSLLKPITQKARGFIPSEAPLSGWGKASINGRFPEWSSQAAKRGIGYKTTPSRPNRSGFRALARIVNNSAAGAIFETAGRVNPNGRSDSKSKNPGAGNMFIEAIDQYGMIVDASRKTGDGKSRKMKGRGIYKAWSEDGGKTNAAVLKAIATAKIKFDAAVGRR